LRTLACDGVLLSGTRIPGTCQLADVSNLPSLANGSARQVQDRD
jgi:hypothetical protein